MDGLSLFLVPALVALLAAASRGTTADDDIGLLATQIGPDSITHQGNDFWIGFMANNRLASVNSADASNLLYITTNEPNPVAFRVELRNGSTIHTGTATYGSTSIVSVPIEMRVAASSDAELDKGIHVTTVNQNEQITVFGLNDESVSADGFLALPCHSYESVTAPPDGVGYQYFIFSSSAQANFQSRFLIVPCQDDTSIDVTPTQNIDFSAEVFSPTTSLLLRAGNTVRLSGQTGQTILLQSPDDLTGTIIVSNKPVSVFTGHECGLVPSAQTACDHLVEQVPPHVTWGTVFLTAPLGLRQSGEHYRIGSIYDGTEVTATCTQQETGVVRSLGPQTINRGEYFSFDTLNNTLVGSLPIIPREDYRPEFCCIQTSEIATVMGYARGHSLDEIPGPGGAQGDPFMMLIPPVTQYFNNFTITQSAQPFNGYISTLIPEPFFANTVANRNNVLLDGAQFEPSDGYFPINCKDGGSDTVCGYGAYSDISDTGDHTVVYDGGPASPLHVYVYGFGREISYGYPAGMELQPIGLPRVSCCEKNTIVSEDIGTFRLCIERTGNMQFATRALYEVSSNSTATEGADYTIGTYANQPELRFRKDDITPRSNALVISITDDDLEEPDEVIVITLLPLQDAFIYPFATCTVTIQNILVEFDSTDYFVHEEDGRVCFSVVKRVDTTRDVTVLLSTYSNSAVGGDDFSAVTLIPVTFTPSDTRQRVEIVITDDNVYEGFESFGAVLTLPEGSGGIVIGSDSNATVVIVDDDDIEDSTNLEAGFFQCFTTTWCLGAALPSATLTECCLGSGFSYSIASVCYNCIVYGWLETEFQGIESQTPYVLSVGVMKGELAQQEFTVQHTGGSANFGPVGDFTFSPDVVTVQDQTNTSIQVALLSDKIALEEPETFQLSLTTSLNCVSANLTFFKDVITVTIVDNDTVSVSFAVSTFNAVEGQNLRLRVEKTGIVATNFTIEVQLLTVSEASKLQLSLPDGLRIPRNEQYSPNRAESGTDFANGSSIVEFSSDEERQQTCPVQDVFVTIIDDDVNEADVQYFIAHLRPLSVESAVNISAVVVEQPAALCSIMDDDAINIVFDREQYTSDEDLESVTVTLTKSNVTSEQTFVFELLPLSSSSSGDLNLSEASTVEFLSNQRTLDIAIPVENDDETEGIEMHQVSLTTATDGPQFGKSDTLQTVVVINDDEIFGCNVSNVSVRLRGGPSNSEGRVEYCSEDEWAPICSVSWTERSAQLVCQELDFEHGLLDFDSNAPAIIVDTYLDNFNCRSEENASLLSDCTFDRVQQCSVSTYASVSCNDCEDGMVRLVNGTSDILYQAVEECVSGRWHPVCADFWNARDGDVTCRQLGSTRQHGYNGASTEDNNMLISRQCNGGENMLRNCTRRMRSICSSGPVSIRCSPLSESQRQCIESDVRIVDGNSVRDGRVEICHDGVWGTVCNSSWDDSDATVVCQQIGFLKGGNSSNHSPGAGPILLSNVSCSGAEGALLDCSNDGVGVHDCIDHSLDAGVTCQECNDGNVTVAEDGRVRFCSSGVLFTICGSTSWTDDEATVVCRQSTDFSSGSAQTLSNGTGPVLTGLFACSGDEASLTDCGNVPGFDASNCTAEAAVICSNQAIIGGLPTTSVAAIAVAAVVFSALVVMCVVLIVCVTYRATKHKHQRPIKFTLRTVDSGPVKVPNRFLEYCENVSDELLISQDSLRLLDVIGQGEFGVVYKAHLVSPPSSTLRRMSDYRTVTRNNKQALQVAVKTLPAFFSDKDVAALMDEFLRMKDFDHHNVLTILGVCVDAGAAPYIVMPYMSNGSLLEFVRDNRDAFIISDPLDTNLTFLTTKMISVCLQISKGMEYLASNNVIHRDLAARNCMISGNWVVKVADFGLSMTAYSNTYTKMKKEADTKLPIKWMAPEAFDLDKFSEKSDVWSFGVTCWEVYSGGSTPYPGMNDPKTLVDFIHGGGRLDKPTSITCSDEMYEILLSCWEVDMQTRPSFSQLVQRIETVLGMVTGYVQLTEAPLQQLRASEDDTENDREESCSGHEDESDIEIETTV